MMRFMFTLLFFLFACAPAITPEEPQNLNTFDNLVWKAARAEASSLVLAQVRSFDPLFANASAQEINKTLTEIVTRAEPYKDTNGKSYQPSILVSSQGNVVVLTFADLVAGTPDLEQDVLSSRLFLAVVKALDAKFERGRL